MSLDKSRFNESLQLKAVKCSTGEVSKYLTKLSPYLLNRACISNTVDQGDFSTRLLLLNPESVKTEQPEFMEAIADLELIDYELNLSYDSYSVIDVLNTVLPKKINPHMITIGSIVYVNLAEEHLEHMNVIGEVVADKMEATSVIGLQNGEVVVLAGNSDLSTEFVEREATIHADLSKCFWSALLQYDRDRVVEKFGRNSVVVDLFGGCGALAARAAQKGCRVIANDPDQACYETIIDNATRNNVTATVHAYNQPASEFIQQIASVLGDTTDESRPGAPSTDLLRAPPLAEVPGIRKITDIVLDSRAENLTLLPRICELMEKYEGIRYHVYLQAKTREDAAKQLFRLQCQPLTESSLLDCHMVRGLEDFFCVSLKLIPDNDEIVSESEGDDALPELPQLDLRKSMMEEMEFMKQSVNDSNVMGQSMLTSMIGSLIFNPNPEVGDSLKRRTDDDKDE